VLDTPEPDEQGVSLINGVFTWTPSIGTASHEPYVITVRATDPIDPGIFVQQDIEIRVIK